MTASSPTPPQPATVDQTIAAIRARCHPLEVQPIPLDDAVGRTLREAVVSDSDQPPFDRSAMDGYAVRLDDPGSTFLVVDQIRAGEWKPRQLSPGEAVRIATGGAIPCDGLQVVMKEDAQVDGEHLTITERDEARHIRFRGEDAKQGQTLIEPGVRVGPGTLALMASVGCVQPVVSRLPSALHITTGDEIVPPDKQPARGQIRDSNSSLVKAFLDQFGIKPIQLRVGEERAAIESALRSPQSAIDQADVLIISGGASVGEHDFTRGLLEEFGYTIEIHRTTTRPGKPMIFASRGDACAFGLPGNPLAHFVCLNLYVRQALWGFAGEARAPDFKEGVVLKSMKFEGHPRETLWPAYAETIDGRVGLRLLRWQSSGDLTSLAAANALVMIAARRNSLSRGVRLPFLST